VKKISFIFRVLQWFCPDHLYEEIEGDLIQKLERDKQKFSNRKATARLYWNTLRFLRPGIFLRNKMFLSLNQSSMLGSYLKTTHRHIAKNKLNFSFKLGGLTFALFSLLIIFIYLSYQVSFDRFHDDYGNIYRVNSWRSENGSLIPYSTVPPAIGPALQQEFPEIISTARMSIANRVVVRYDEKLLRFTGFAEADSSVFQILTFDFLLGDKHALDQPGSVVLTKSVSAQTPT
jgi:putative ABC transport system permease protein